MHQHARRYGKGCLSVLMLVLLSYLQYVMHKVIIYISSIIEIDQIRFDTTQISDIPAL